MQRKEQNTEREPLNWRKELLSWIQILAIVAIIAYVFSTLIIANSHVPNASMENTVMTKDRAIGPRLSYYFGDPQWGNIVIFYFPNDESLFCVKRITGLPGGAIDIKDGHACLNNFGTPPDEPYSKEAMVVEPDLHCEVPEDFYFVMGGNRNSSADSRRWRNTFVKREKTIAKVTFRYWPSLGVIE